MAMPGFDDEVIEPLAREVDEGGLTGNQPSLGNRHRGGDSLETRHRNGHDGRIDALGDTEGRIDVAGALVLLHLVERPDQEERRCRWSSSRGTGRRHPFARGIDALRVGRNADAASDGQDLPSRSTTVPSGIVCPLPV
jgi:hypothetical protein